uniref:Uncharacterized protein n=1 Tax=Arundo donax TaxID=35708 RepID=A0A0A9FHT7_ARUDO
MPTENTWRLDGASALAPRNAAPGAAASATPGGRRVTLGGAQARNSRPPTSRDPCSSRAVICRGRGGACASAVVVVALVPRCWEEAAAATGIEQQRRQLL